MYALTRIGRSGKFVILPFPSSFAFCLSNPAREDVELADKTLAQRIKEARAQKKFVVDSPDTYDLAAEGKYERLYIDTLVKNRWRLITGPLKSPSVHPSRTSESVLS